MNMRELLVIATLSVLCFFSGMSFSYAACSIANLKSQVLDLEIAVQKITSRR